MVQKLTESRFLRETSATPVSGRGITGGGPGTVIRVCVYYCRTFYKAVRVGEEYAALLARNESYGIELGSVTLKINNQQRESL